MSSREEILRDAVKRSSLEEANRSVYPNLTHGTTSNNGLSTSPGKPCPFFCTKYCAKYSWQSFAGLGMVISAQWELVLGNSFGYTVLSGFGFFYAGFGAILTPLFGVTESYGINTAEYNNALGLFVLMWTVFNTFFLIGSLPINLIYFGIFATVEVAFGLVAASYFAAADNKHAVSEALKKAGGAFAFVSGMLGYYTVAHLMCQEALFFSFPMGDTSRFFIRKSKAGSKDQ